MTFVKTSMHYSRMCTARLLTDHGRGVCVGGLGVSTEGVST